MHNNEVLAPDIPRIIYQSSFTDPTIGQCDACSSIVFAKNPFLQPVTSIIPYYTPPEIVEQTIDPTYHAVLSPFTEMFSMLNESAMFCFQYFRYPKPLESIPATWFETWGESTVQSILAKMIHLGLLVPESYVAPDFTEVLDTLVVWLHLTDCCNLRCTYCYLPHKNVSISVETGRAVIDATFRSAIAHNYQKVKFKYAGGEPLLRFSLISELQQYAHTLADQHGFLLDGIVLTNGTILTPKIIRKIQSLDLRVMISLDSLGNFHEQRLYPDGSGTANDVMRNIDIALDCGLVPDISITVCGKNVKEMSDIVSWILERDLPFSFNFYRENDFSDSYTGLRLEEENIITGMLAAYKAVEANLPNYSLLASLIDRANLSVAHLRPCSVGHSYLVFDPLGRISKCQMQMDKPITTCHTKDPLALIRIDKNGIQNISVEKKEECQFCEWKYWCAGGCPLETFRATGRYDIKSPNCNIYKTLYPEVIHLEGLRILKYASLQ